MNRTFKRAWDVVSTAVVALAVVLAVLLSGARFAGFQVFAVLSGSMEPAYHTGSLIYVRKTAPEKLQAGQVITFLLDENTVATHRIVEVVPDEKDPEVLRFRTKGDANDIEDGGLVHEKNVIGVPVFTIPYLGYFADYIQHPPGTYIAVTAGVVFLVLLFLPDMLKAAEQADKKNGHSAAGRQ